MAHTKLSLIKSPSSSGHGHPSALMSLAAFGREPSLIRMETLMKRIDWKCPRIDFLVRSARYDRKKKNKRGRKEDRQDVEEIGGKEGRKEEGRKKGGKEEREEERREERRVAGYRRRDEVSGQNE